MKKENEMKSNSVGNQSEEKLNLIVQEIGQKGDAFGNAIIDIMPLKEIDLKTMGIIVIGLAKALAMAKDIARRSGMKTDKLHRSELTYYSRRFAKITID